MSNNCFIVTGNGFIMDIAYEIPFICQISYTPHLYNAKMFTSKGAKNFIIKHNLCGFVYNPLQEEPIRNMYQIKKLKVGTYFQKEKDVYEPVLVRMVHESDREFLSNRFVKTKDKLFTKEQAIEECNRLNQETIDLINKITLTINNL